MLPYVPVLFLVIHRRVLGLTNNRALEFDFDEKFIEAMEKMATSGQFQLYQKLALYIIEDASFGVKRLVEGARLQALEKLAQLFRSDCQDPAAWELVYNELASFPSVSQHHHPVDSAVETARYLVSAMTHAYNGTYLAESFMNANIYAPHAYPDPGLIALKSIHEEMVALLKGRR